MKSKMLLMFVALALAGTACDLPISANTDETVSPNGSVVLDNQVLFKDDFSDSRSGWEQNTFDNHSTDYELDGYRIVVNVENYSVWANPGHNFSDLSVSVEANKIGGDDDNEFGLICRHANVDNFYAATISSDGFFAFLLRKDGEAISLLNMENMRESNAINHGEAINSIRLDCIGQTLTLYVNGELVGETMNSSISSGDVGLYAGTFSVAGTDILFDNFVVRTP